jgi:hypothetical protein
MLKQLFSLAKVLPEPFLLGISHCSKLATLTFGQIYCVPGMGWTHNRTRNMDIVEQEKFRVVSHVFPIFERHGVKPGLPEKFPKQEKFRVCEEWE